VKQLLEIATSKADSAEVFMTSNESNQISFENSKVNEISDKIQTGYALRIIKNGKIGSSYTKNLLDRDDVVNRALDSLHGGVEAKFDFPQAHTPGELKMFDPEMENISTHQVLEGAKQINSSLAPQVSGQVNIYTGFSKSKTALINSNGVDLSQSYSEMFSYPAVMYPGGYANISKLFVQQGFHTPSSKELDQIAQLFSAGETEVSPASGPISVIFTPSTMFSLFWRFSEATNAQAVFEKTSPLISKIGKKIFSDKITIFNDPIDLAGINSRGFDDEGVPTKKLTLVENGVLKSFYNDLHYAAKLDMAPTGTGYKGAMWGGETVSLKPAPSLTAPRIACGDQSLMDMIRGIKRGVLLFGALGAHSGNITSGDFSIGINPGLYIENGEIIGRIKDGMVAGNIYDIFQRVSAVENRDHFSSMGKYPSICFEDVSLVVN
jgi:PmbA protein